MLLWWFLLLVVLYWLVGKGLPLAGAAQAVTDTVQIILLCLMAGICVWAISGGRPFRLATL